MNTAIVGANVTMSSMSIADAVAEATLIDNNNHEEEEENDNEVDVTVDPKSHGHNDAIAIDIMNNHPNNQDDIISVNSSPPITVSSATPLQKESMID